MWKIGLNTARLTVKFTNPTNIIGPAIKKKKTVKIAKSRGAESESELPGVVATSQESEWIILHRLWLRILILDMIRLCRGEFVCTYLEIISAAIVFKFWRWLEDIYVLTQGGEPWLLNADPRGQVRPFPPPTKAPENETILTYSSI